MTWCYSCEYKEYKRGDRVPNSKCPSDCTVLQLFSACGVNTKGMLSAAKTLKLEVDVINGLKAFLAEYEKFEGGLDKEFSDVKQDYKRIYDWHKMNSDLIYDRLGRKDGYTEAYKQLIIKLPRPDEATKEDILLIANQVRSGLMEWSYHEAGEDGLPMIKRAQNIFRK